MISGDSEVLTTEGWKTIGDTPQLTDIVVFISNLKKIYVERPLSIERKSYKGKMIHINNSTNTDQLVTPNHKVLTVSHRNIMRWQDAFMVGLNKSILVPFYEECKVQNTWCNNMNRENSIEEIDYEGFVFSIRTESKAIIIRRNGKTAITGGT